MVLGGELPCTTGGICAGSGGEIEGGGGGCGWLSSILRSSSLSSKVLSSSLSKGSSSRSKSARLRQCTRGVLGRAFLGPRLGAGSGVRMSVWHSPAKTGLSAGGGGSWSFPECLFPSLPSASWAKPAWVSASCLAAAAAVTLRCYCNAAISCPQRTLLLSREKSYCRKAYGGI